MPDTSQVRILLLDDEPYMLKLIGFVLAKLGYAQVTACDSGVTALDHIDRADQAPDIILLDLNMPEMDGLEFVRHLVHRNYLGSVALVSGEDDRMLQTAESLIRAHGMTVLGRVNKTITPQALGKLLGAWHRPGAGKQTAERVKYSAQEIRQAIAQGQFVNYYQPQIAVSTCRLLGVETLVRWRHPEHGMVFPDQFIGVAEETGLIEDLTAAIVTASLSQLVAWREAGLTMRCAINVSMDNLASLEFPNFVARQAALANIAPREVTLEVTESRLTKDLRAPLEILTRLRLKRFSLSIDDFGTGHSSLSQLRDFPFDELKVDRGFVHGAAQNETVRAIFDASLGLAKQLNMVSVAEGVEDRADWDFVRRSTCDVAQGYFVARPMPAADIPDWKSSWEARVEKEQLLAG